MYEWQPRSEELADDIPTDNRKIPWFPGCKGCAFALETEDGWKKTHCMVYPKPEYKPTQYEHKGRCPHYEEE